MDITLYSVKLSPTCTYAKGVFTHGFERKYPAHKSHLKSEQLYSFADETNT